MFDSDPNGLEDIATIKTDVEQAILLHSWAQTSQCPACGCDSSLCIGPETETPATSKSIVCCAMMQEIVGGIDSSELL